MLEGGSVDLRVAQRDDLDLLHKWYNDSGFFGEHEPIATPVTREAVEREVLEPKAHNGDRATFLILKKDGTAIGDINYRGGTHSVPVEIGYALIPTERGKGYGTEAIMVLVDYIFLAKDIPRIQATTLTDNTPSQRALEKAGFKREGEMRSSSWVRGSWRNDYLYSITRDDWAGPRVLQGTPARPKR